MVLIEYNTLKRRNIGKPIGFASSRIKDTEMAIHDKLCLWYHLASYEPDKKTPQLTVYEEIELSWHRLTWVELVVWRFDLLKKNIGNFTKRKKHRFLHYCRPLLFMSFSVVLAVRVISFFVHPLNWTFSRLRWVDSYFHLFIDSLIEN